MKKWEWCNTVGLKRRRGSLDRLPRRAVHQHFTGVHRPCWGNLQLNLAYQPTSRLRHQHLAGGPTRCPESQQIRARVGTDCRYRFRFKRRSADYRAEIQRTVLSIMYTLSSVALFRNASTALSASPRPARFAPTKPI